MKQPKVTVLMGVYNGETYLREAIESILAQTFTDFEFVIIDDGSTDKSLEIIKSYTDPRIRLVRNPKNMRLIYTLNRGLDLAKGEYVARMDADDISDPTRLEKQVTFLDNHSKVGVCGTYVRIFTRIPGVGVTPKFPTKSEEIKATLLFENAVQHPAVMLRKKILDKYMVRYSSDFLHIEDYELWVRLAKYCDFAIIPEVLLFYRLHAKQIGQVHGAKQFEGIHKLRQIQFSQLKMKLTAAEFDLHQDLCFGRIKPEKQFVQRSEVWLKRILTANSKVGVYNQQALEDVVGKKWHTVCVMSLKLRGWVWKRFWKSSLNKFSHLTSTELRYFWIECNLVPFIRPTLIKVRNHPTVKKFLLAR